MIDVSKIRVGDHLDIRMRVTRASVDGHDREFCLEYDAERRIVVNSRDHGNLILAHTPAPREFKPGDRVTWVKNDEHIWKIIATHGVSAWSKWDGYAYSDGPDACSPHFGKYETHLISDLRHADESE
jgi:plastocyanin